MTTADQQRRVTYLRRRKAYLELHDEFIAKCTEGLEVCDCGSQSVQCHFSVVPFCANCGGTAVTSPSAQDLVYELEDITCPKCGEMDDTRYYDTSPANNIIWACLSCHHRWVVPKPKNEEQEV